MPLWRIHPLLWRTIYSSIQRLQALGQRFDKTPYLVTNATELSGNLPGRTDRPGRIVELSVYDFRLTRKDRAVFFGIIANRYHIIKLDTAKVIDMLGIVTGYINPRFRHCADGPAAYYTRVYPRTERLNAVTLQRVGPALSHLAAA